MGCPYAREGERRSIPSQKEILSGQPPQSDPSLVISYWVRVITEDLPDGDPEDWRHSFMEAFGALRSRSVRSVATAFDAKWQRMVLTFEVSARTGTAVIEMITELLKQMGEHPELIAVRQMLLYPAKGDEGSVIAFDDVAQMFGPEDWKALEEQQFEPDYDPD